MHKKDTQHHRDSCLLLYPNALKGYTASQASCIMLHPNALKGYVAPQS